MRLSQENEDHIGLIPLSVKAAGLLCFDGVCNLFQKKMRVLYCCLRVIISSAPLLIFQEYIIRLHANL